jgi:hypothetical protein
VVTDDSGDMLMKERVMMAMEMVVVIEILMIIAHIY